MEVPNQTIIRATFFQGSRENPFNAILLAAGDSWQSIGMSWLIDISFQFLPLSSHGTPASVCLCLPVSSFLFF